MSTSSVQEKLFFFFSFFVKHRPFSFMEKKVSLQYDIGCYASVLSTLFWPLWNFFFLFFFCFSF